MKIEDLSNLQDILKCNKDKAHIKEMRAKKKIVDHESSILKYQISELRAKQQLLDEQSQTISGIIAQSKNIIVRNDVSISIIEHSKSIRINKTGTFLVRRWPRAEFEISLEKGIVISVRSSVKTFYSKYMKQARNIRSKNEIVNIGLDYVAGLLTGTQVENKIYI